MQLPRRVVVTGMGLISPLGNSVNESWSNCIKGCSGISENVVDLEDMPIKVGGRIHDFDPTQYIDSKDIRRLDTFVQYGVSAGIQAIEDAGLDNNVDKDRVGLNIGSGIAMPEPIFKPTLSLSLGVSGFLASRALSKSDDPKTASRPWDKDRDGFVLSDGAAILILEEYEHAKNRSANIYAEVIGFGMSSDAYHMTAPSEDGTGASLSISRAISDAGISTNDIDYINAHATSKPLGDLAECNAVKSIFDSPPPISSTKSMTGHTLGAAGAVESIFSILSIVNNISPPTINLNNPDEGCDLDFIPNQARDMKIDISLNNSFGFGGTNSTLIFKSV